MFIIDWSGTVAMYAIALMVSTVTCILLAIFIWNRRPARGTFFLALLMMANAVWSAAYMLEILAPSIASKYLFFNITFIAKSALLVFWFYFTLKYTGQEKVLTPRNQVLFLIVPILTIIAVWTNDIHGLVWTTIEVDFSNPIVVLNKTYGILFWLGALYFYVVMIIGAAVIVRAAIKLQALNSKVIALVAGIALPMLVKAVTVFVPGILNNLDVTPFVFTMCWCLVCWYVFRTPLLDVVPVARDALIEQMTDGIIVVDINSNVLYHNHAAIDIVSHGEPSIVGKPIAQILPCCGNLADMAGTAPIHNLGTNDENKHFVVQVLFLRNSEDMPGGYLISLRDITDRVQDLEQLQHYKEHLEELVEERTMELTEVNAQLQAKFAEHQQAENQLREQKELIDRILVNTPNAVAVVNAKMQILLANPVFCHICSLTHDEVVGESVTAVLPVADWVEQISKVLRGDETQMRFEFRRRIADEDRIIIARVLHMQADEVLLLLNDITDERQRQERLYFTDRMASVGQMAAGIAHELNNPLTGIIGLSQLLLENSIPTEIKEDIGSIFSEAQRAAGIVRGLLAFSRRQASAKQPVQVNDVLEEVLKLRSYEHKIKNIQVITKFDSTLPEVFADRLQIQQLFMNIILNAHDAMLEAHNKGMLIIATEHVEQIVKISFTDNGMGIPQQNLKRIFDPFFTTKEVGKGTGLGLSICYGIITNHDGKIYAQSEQSMGATFIVELPEMISDAAEETKREVGLRQVKENAAVR
jgi:PAS domain S-box-containing protein